MAKVGILMPHPELKELAESMIQDYHRITPVCIEYVSTPRIADRVSELVDTGCEMIIARGLQAQIARNTVSIPIVEMRASIQELGMLFQDLREKITQKKGSADPAGCTIGLIGFFNMFENTDQLGKMLQINIKSYRVTNIDQYATITDHAVDEGCQGVIGGEVVCQRAAELGVPSKFLTMGEESMRDALSTANLIGYSIDLRKRSNIEMNAMLDYTFNGIMQISSEGIISRVNRACSGIIGKDSRDLVGKDIRQVMPALKVQTLNEVLTDGQEVQAEVILIRSSAVLTNIVPILFDSKIDGAILTFQEEKKIVEMDSKLRQEHYRRGFIENHTFDSIITENKAHATLISQMKRIAKYPAPVLLLGEIGVRKAIYAQSIHNASIQTGAFISLDCSVWHPDDLDTMLFGKYTTKRDERTLIEEARGGTLYLTHIESMAKETQYKLLHLLRGWYEHNGPNQPEIIDVRLIFSTEADLKSLTQTGAFRPDLYYALSILEMKIPPLRERKEDIPQYMEKYLQQKKVKYGKEVHLTEDAIQFVTNYSWPGNLDQLDNLCERIVLLERKRNIDKAILEQHLQEVEPTLIPVPQNSEANVIYRDPAAVAFEEALKRNFGNREKTAEEMGISKTTLWRKLKKYGLQ